MKFTTILTTFAAMATASPAFTTTSTTETSIAAAKTPPTNVPLCRFDPVKGEYMCPANKTTPTTSKDSPSTAVAAADCNKCRADWDECIKHWGCRFYDCIGPCKCDVGRKDPSCTACEFGKC
ncbi:hypothetical protein N0V95_008092 [Ascochyta clinopodiicola]|nr:hypothetical protein N0V95_008092 [Ascochyta clinopodiicola]